MNTGQNVHKTKLSDNSQKFGNNNFKNIYTFINSGYKKNALLGDIGNWKFCDWNLPE